MLFIIVIACLMAYTRYHTEANAQELWFMMSAFTGLAYVAGFLDSRLVRHFDQKNANRLAETETRYEQTINAEPNAH